MRLYTSRMTRSVLFLVFLELGYSVPHSVPTTQGRALENGVYPLVQRDREGGARIEPRENSGVVEL